MGAVFGSGVGEAKLLDDVGGCIKVSHRWVTVGSSLEAMWEPLGCLPKELIREIASYLVYAKSPPTMSPLPRRILNAVPYRLVSDVEEGSQEFVENLVGSSIYLVHDRKSPIQQKVSGPVARSPFVIVWAAVHQQQTYFGVVFPSVVFNSDRMSLVFGPAQDLATLELPRTDCSLVFYDLDVAQQNPPHLSKLQQPDVDYTICRIRSLNLATNHNRSGKRKIIDGYPIYPVLVVRISGLVTKKGRETPFYERMFPADLFAPADHPLWPWNQ